MLAVFLSNVTIESSMPLSEPLVPLLSTLTNNDFPRSQFPKLLSVNNKGVGSRKKKCEVLEMT